MKSARILCRHRKTLPAKVRAIKFAASGGVATKHYRAVCTVVDRCRPGQMSSGAGRSYARAEICPNSRHGDEASGDCGTCGGCLKLGLLIGGHL